MPYTPPSGWVEQPTAATEAGAQTPHFHVRRDCPAIPAGVTLRATDKPYSAPRCPTCAK